MFALSSAALLRLVLLAAPAGASGPSPLPTCASGTRHLELTADTPSEVPEVCIRPGRSSSFFFNAKLARVELAGRERFRVLEDEVGFALMPMRALPDGERVPVTVSIQDGVAPARATFLLVVHPSESEQQVVVMRQPRTVASYREGEQRALEEVQRGRKVVRLAVAQELQNNGDTPWTPADAVLMRSQGQELKALGMWPLEPLAPGASAVSWWRWRRRRRRRVAPSP